jgi:phosphoglycolate phosphatase
MNSETRSDSVYDVVIFDLDGTLVDSRLDLANSVNFTRVRMGLPVIENGLIYSFVGNGAPMLIRRAMGPRVSEADVTQALEIFLEHYRLHLLDNTTLYPGVREALDQLYSLTLAVLTNKPINATKAILKGLGILDKFAAVYGGNSFEQKKPYPIGVYKILQDSRVPKERALIVGDSRVDVQTGRNAGIATCGVTYGLASETLKAPKPDYLVDDVRELLKIIYPR